VYLKINWKKSKFTIFYLFTVDHHNKQSVN
jgi:hypothetical protein